MNRTRLFDMKKKRERLVQLQKEQKLYPKKYNYGHKTVIVMPPAVPKKDLTDFAYGMDIDEKVVKMATGLAEKMAIAMIRESLSLNTDQLVEKLVGSLSDKIIAAMPEQKTIIQRVVSDETSDLKKEAGDLVFESADLSFDRSKGLKLHGKVGEELESKDSTDDALDMLEDLL